MPIIVDKNRCPQNHVCPLLSVCPVGAITQEGFGLPEVDPQKCIECGDCIDNCGMGAFELKD